MSPGASPASGTVLGHLCLRPSRSAHRNLPKRAGGSLMARLGGQTWCFQVSSHDIRRVPFPH